MYRFNAEDPRQSLYTPTTVGVIIGTCRISDLWWWMPFEEVCQESRTFAANWNSEVHFYFEHCHWQNALQGSCWFLVQDPLQPLHFWCSQQCKIWYNLVMCTCTVHTHKLSFAFSVSTRRLTQKCVNRYSHGFHPTHISQHMNKCHFLFYILYLCDEHNRKKLQHVI